MQISTQLSRAIVQYFILILNKFLGKINSTHDSLFRHECLLVKVDLVNSDMAGDDWLSGPIIKHARPWGQPKKNEHKLWLSKKMRLDTKRGTSRLLA